MNIAKYTGTQSAVWASGSCCCTAQVVEVIQAMVEVGEEEAAAQLLADLAHRARTLACEFVIELTTQASFIYNMEAHHGANTLPLLIAVHERSSPLL